jgi:uncharacterized protein
MMPVRPNRVRPPKPIRAAVAALGLVLLVLLPGCGDPGSSAAQPVSQAREISFTTADGVTLDGHLFGNGQAGVILSHMYPADQSSWYPTAERLAAEGYLVLTYDFRGYGKSSGTKQIDKLDKDTFAAVTELRRQGAAEVVLVGASMGGTASLIAGDQAQLLSSIRLAGIATLSAPVEFMGLSAKDAVPRIVVPLLFIAAEKDAGAAGAQELEQLSGGKGILKIVPGKDHGTDLLSGSQAGTVYTLLRDFLHGAIHPITP